MKWNTNSTIQKLNVSQMTNYSMPWVQDIASGIYSPVSILDPQHKLSHLLAGLMLSDGYLYKTYKANHNSALGLDLGWNEVSFFLLTTTLLLLKECGLATGTFVQRKRTAHKDFYVAYGYSKRHYLFTILYQMWYVDGNKVLPLNIDQYMSPLTLAIWFAGDGNARGAGVELNTHNFTYNEVVLLKTILQHKFNLSPTIQNDASSHVLVFKKVEAIKFVSLVRPLLHPSVLYKCKHVPQQN